MLMVIRILGIDPGSRLTGYGCVELNRGQVRVLTHGVLKLNKDNVGVEVRLKRMFEGLREIIEQHKPTEIAIEKVFMAKNVVSGLKLGQARGVALLCAGIYDMKLHEYAATEVKKTVTGYGRAEKDQVAMLLKLGYKATDFETQDASDALAIAICHAQNLMSRKSVGPTAFATPGDHKPKTGKGRMSLAQALGLDLNKK